MEIINGQVQFSFSLGNDITRVTAHHQGGVSDGKWHEVNIGYLNRVSRCEGGVFRSAEGTLLMDNTAILV